MRRPRTCLDHRMLPPRGGVEIQQQTRLGIDECQATGERFAHRLRLFPRRARPGKYAFLATAQQRTDSANGNPTICPFRGLRIDFQVLFAVTLRDEIFRGNTEIFDQHSCD